MGIGQRPQKTVRWAEAQKDSEMGGGPDREEGGGLDSERAEARAMRRGGGLGK